MPDGERLIPEKWRDVPAWLGQGRYGIPFYQPFEAAFYGKYPWEHAPFRQERARPVGEAHPDEETYGIRVEGVNVVLPSGQVTTLTWWDSLTDKQKLEQVGGKVVGNYIYTPDGKSFTFESMGIPKGTSVFDVLAGLTPPDEPTVDEPKKPFDPLAMTDYQQFLADQAQREFQWGQQQDIEARRQWDIEAGQEIAAGWNERQRIENLQRNLGIQQIWQAGVGGGDARGWQAQIDAQMSERWKEWRNYFQREFGRDPDLNWIPLAQLEQMKNPYLREPDDDTLMGEIKILEEGVKSAKLAAKTARNIEKEYKDANMSLGQSLKGEIEGAKEQERYANTRLFQKQLERGRSVEGEWARNLEEYNLTHKTPRPGGFVGSSNIWAELEEEPRERQGVAVPQFLQDIVPGLGAILPTGNIPKGEIPSPQSWRQLSPTQQKRVRGYWKYAEQPEEDIFASMERMKPQPLRLGRTWRAPQQV